VLHRSVTRNRLVAGYSSIAQILQQSTLSSVRKTLAENSAEQSYSLTSLLAPPPPRTLVRAAQTLRFSEFYTRVRTALYYYHIGFLKSIRRCALTHTAPVGVHMVALSTVYSGTQRASVLYMYTILKRNDKKITVVRISL
jgi:hypothetical protein